MIDIRKCVNESKKLEEALKKNAESHKNYKTYTSMERALDLLLTGNVYLSNGSNWNDTKDKAQMQKKDAFGISFSYSTRENVAMWMLYGDQRAEKGAAINYLPSVIRALLSVEEIEAGNFDKAGKFCCIEKIGHRDVELFLTDIVYVDERKISKDDNKIKDSRKEENDLSSFVNITVQERHAIVDKEILTSNRNIFCKAYPWAYENECRLITRLKRSYQLESEFSHIRLRIPQGLLRKMRNNRIIRSPKYAGTEYGEKSEITGEIDWEI